MSHVLVVGGTGMLRGVSLYLASQAHTVSVVARRSHRLKSLAQQATRLAGQINPIQVDYRDERSLRAELKEAIGVFGPVALAVCWIHSAAPQAPYIVADSINTGPKHSRYFHILGSAAANPTDQAFQLETRFRRFEYIMYRKIILGFVIEDGVPRWLTNDEICTGVIQAIERDAASYVVGTVQPWSLHP